jgi:hypothetical protein
MRPWYIRTTVRVAGTTPRSPSELIKSEMVIDAVSAKGIRSPFGSITWTKDVATSSDIQR